MALPLAPGSILAELPPSSLDYLEAQGVPRRFARGSALMRQGEVAEVMYVITSGGVRVERSHPDLSSPVTLAELGPGQIVGEIGVLDGEPRTATVTATQDTQAVELSAATVALALHGEPSLALALLQVVSRRLRDTDSLIDQIRRKGWSQ